MAFRKTQAFICLKNSNPKIYLGQDWYKINNNISYGLLKNRIINLLFTETNTDIVMKELNSLFKKHLVPIRPNRSTPRHNKKYKRRDKPKVAKNQKDAI
ncbi:MAG: hypothetical protein CSA94_02660 [Bacteroidetes bacterium]|nr:MAG: hypothetical protein CSA94_02660 [Bacteroidota bacterium]